jgi:hypothetical protein
VALVVDINDANGGARLCRRTRPWQEIGVVLRNRENHLVAAPEVRGTPGAGDEIESLGRTSREDHFGRMWGIDEARDRLPCRGHASCGSAGQRVDRCRVRVVTGIERRERVDHRLRAQGRRGSVQIREGVTADLLAKGRKRRCARLLP